MAEVAATVFACAYILLVIGSILFLSYAWYKDMKRRKRPKLKLVKRKDG